MLSLVANARLPAKPEYPGASNVGIELDYLQSLKDLWVGGWNWDEAQSEFNECVLTDLRVWCRLITAVQVQAIQDYNRRH